MGVRLDNIERFSGTMEYQESKAEKDGERVTGDTDEYDVARGLELTEGANAV